LFAGYIHVLEGYPLGTPGILKIKTTTTGSSKNETLASLGILFSKILKEFTYAQ
jgi:hypothetical protein